MSEREHLTTADLVRGDRNEPDEVDLDQEERQPLLPGDATGDFRGRWDSIQIGFVDEPRRSVEEADNLVAELMQQLARTFSDERTRLESQWDKGDEASTEELRVALQRYRSFFDRLLST
jgi:hypothetical protein